MKFYTDHKLLFIKKIFHDAIKQSATESKVEALENLVNKTERAID